MNRKVYFACACMALAAAAACASTEDDPGGVDPGSDSGTPLPDAGEASAPEEADAGPEDAAVDTGPSCSSMGWCATQLPDPDLTLRDVWPFPGSALAIATSPTVGTKILEWTDAAGAWRYVDDNSQNEGGRGRFVGKLWASSADELYFTVAPRTVFRGRRSGSPATWTWTHSDLEDRTPVYPAPTSYPDHFKGFPKAAATFVQHAALGVFGTSVNDVYAWFGNAIYKMSIDAAGAPAWSVEYVADDIDRPDEQLIFVAGTGTGPDDMWFAGGRTGGPDDQRGCVMLVHKTAAGYRRVADAIGVASPPPPNPIPLPPPPPHIYCQARPDRLLLPGTNGIGSWLTDISVESANSVVALNGQKTLARISVNGDVYSASTLTVPPSVAVRSIISLWSAPNEPIWLGGTGLVARGQGVWSDAGAFEISSIALNGAPLLAELYRIRASSSSDRWAVGARYALHKTTP